MTAAAQYQAALDAVNRSGFELTILIALMLAIVGFALIQPTKNNRR